MNIMAIIAAMLLPGPDFEVPRKNFYILVDTKSKNEYTVRRSKLVRELEIDDTRFLPSQLYYLRSKYDFIVQEFEDRQTEVVSGLPAFRLSKNEKWQEFAPGTFAADGMFTLSVFAIAKWMDFEQDVYEFNTNRSYDTRGRFPFTYPHSFLKHFNKRNVLLNMPNLQYYLIGEELPEDVEELLNNSLILKE